MIKTEYLEMVTGGDAGILSDLVDIFKVQADEFSEEMDKLFKAGDFPGLGLLAHKAKSSVAIMGMDDLAAMLKNFELEAKSGENKEKYGDYITRFNSDIKIAILELDHYSGKA